MPTARVYFTSADVLDNKFLCKAAVEARRSGKILDRSGTQQFDGGGCGVEHLPQQILYSFCHRVSGIESAGMIELN